MAKFKVGDKVRVTYGWALGSVGIIKNYDETMKDHFRVWMKTEPNHSSIPLDGGFVFYSCESLCELVVEQPRREFIVIRRSGAETIAELRHDREVIKSAKATCAPSDTFDLDTGAKLAFDRLMGRLNPLDAGKTITIPSAPSVTVNIPQPAHRFKVGDRVVVIGKHNGEVSAIDEKNPHGEIYLVYCPAVGFHSGGEHGVDCKEEHRGNCTWRGDNDLSPAPAPEPPKFYTGKVFAIKANEGMSGNSGRVNRIFEVVNGIFVGDYSKFQIPSHESSPFKSFDEICERLFGNEWREVKE